MFWVCCCAGSYCSGGGCRAALSVPGALVAQGVMCECGVLVRCTYSGLVGGLMFAARAALSACVGGLAFLVGVCLRWPPALVSDCLCRPHHHVSL